MQETINDILIKIIDALNWVGVQPWLAVVLIIGCIGAIIWGLSRIYYKEE